MNGTAWHVMFALALLAAAAPAAELDAEQERRFHALTQELRCLVCQNQSIADSNAPLAEDLRKQVRARIAAGESDAAIKDYVTARYGDYVLYRPPLKSHTLLLWGGPFALLLLAALVAGTQLGRRARAHASKPDARALQIILDDEHKGAA